MINDEQNGLEITVRNQIKNNIRAIRTSLIAKVTAVNEKTVDVQPVVQAVFEKKNITLPEFKEVPLITLQGGSSFIHFPVAVGDYCLLIVNERCFDNWYHGDDNAPPLTPRTHDYSDSFAIVGINNLAGGKAIPETTTIIGDVNATGNWHITGNVRITGNIDVSGYIHANGDIVAGGGTVSLLNHTHTGVHGETSTGH